ncbi:MAG: hypothetical protein ACXWZY_11625 [Gaiellaceae bacterium]
MRAAGSSATTFGRSPTSFSWQAGGRLGDTDWEAIHEALQPTDEAHGRWADHSIPGTDTIILRFAWMDKENEGTYVSVEVSGSDKVEAVATTLIEVMQAYRLEEDR